MAGLLAYFLLAAPSRPDKSGQWQKMLPVLKIYSCGYSSGFTPDSLFNSPFFFLSQN